MLADEELDVAVVSVRTGVDAELAAEAGVAPPNELANTLLNALETRLVAALDIRLDDTLDKRLATEDAALDAALEAALATLETTTEPAADATLESRLDTDDAALDAAETTIDDAALVAAALHPFMLYGDTLQRDSGCASCVTVDTRLVPSLAASHCPRASSAATKSPLQSHKLGRLLPTD